MSIGTAIVIVGTMFFLLVSAMFVFLVRQWRRMDTERDGNIAEIEARRDSIKRGARRTDHRFNPND